MFNFRFFSLGTNNQLHLLPIKVLMAHQSKKNHCKRSLHKLCTHVISLEVIFYFQKEIKSINYTLKALCTAPTTVLIVTLHLKLWGQALLLLKDLGASYLKCNNVALNAEASRTRSCFYGAWQKLITRFAKSPWSTSIVQDWWNLPALLAGSCCSLCRGRNWSNKRTDTSEDTQFHLFCTEKTVSPPVHSKKWHEQTMQLLQHSWSPGGTDSITAPLGAWLLAQVSPHQHPPLHNKSH